MMAATSRAAYQSVPLQQREREVMLACHRHFPAPARFTRKELAAAMRWEINRVTGRVLTLIERGFLTEHDQTRDGAHLLSVTEPKTTAPAPAATGESTVPAAQSATGKPATLPAIANVPPVAAVPIPAGASAIEIARIRAAQAQANRQAMPTVTACVDAFRRIFEDAKVVYAQEGGREVGKPGPEGVAASDSRPGLERKRAA